MKILSQYIPVICGVIVGVIVTIVYIKMYKPDFVRNLYEEGTSTTTLLHDSVSDLASQCSELEMEEIELEKNDDDDKEDEIEETEETEESDSDSESELKEI